VACDELLLHSGYTSVQTLVTVRSCRADWRELSVPTETSLRI